MIRNTDKCMLKSWKMTTESKLLNTFWAADFSLCNTKLSFAPKKPKSLRYHKAPTNPPPLYIEKKAIWENLWIFFSRHEKAREGLEKTHWESSTAKLHYQTSMRDHRVVISADFFFQYTFFTISSTFQNLHLFSNSSSSSFSLNVPKIPLDLIT